MLTDLESRGELLNYASPELLDWWDDHKARDEKMRRDIASRKVAERHATLRKIEELKRQL